MSAYLEIQASAANICFHVSLAAISKLLCLAVMSLVRLVINADMGCSSSWLLQEFTMEKICENLNRVGRSSL